MMLASLTVVYETGSLAYVIRRKNCNRSGESNHDVFLAASRIPLRNTFRTFLMHDQVLSIVIYNHISLLSLII